MANKRYVKLNSNVLVEWTFDDTNLIAEDYKVLVPDGTTIPNFAYSQASTTFGVDSVTNNLRKYQLYQIDPIEKKYGIVDDTIYDFLHIQDYPASVPVAHDTVKLWFPINYTFSDKVGLNIKIYTYDFNNENIIELSNFYYDKTDINMTGLLDFPSQALNFQEALWGKCITLQIPSINEVALQRGPANPNSGSINANITGGITGFGLSQTSPIFIDFAFIEKKEAVLGINNFYLGNTYTASLPQTPEYKTLGVSIEESENGDFFEIVGTYNGNSSEFNKFISDMSNIGQVYYVQYDITLYEENVPRTTEKRLITSNFSDVIEYRPIIKTSNTTAAIQVSMHLINLVDESQITRIATYGLLRDQISKYGNKLLRINTINAFKPKIYNDSNSDLYRKTDSINYTQNKIVEKVEVPFPAIALDSRIIIQDRNGDATDGKYYGKGQLKIPIRPFDNIFKFSVAKKIDDRTTQPYDLSNAGQIKLVFKGNTDTIETDLYYDSGEVSLELGVLVFKIDESKVSTLKKLYNNSENLFYITVSNNGIKTTLYDGKFMPDNSIEYTNYIQSLEEDENTNTSNNANNAISNTISSVNTGLNRFTSNIKSAKVTVVKGTKSLVVKKVDVSTFKKIKI